MLPRIVHSLGQAHIAWPALASAGCRACAPRWIGCATTPRPRRGLAEAAGCSPRTVELIRWQDAPRDPEAGERLRLADEAN